MLRRGWASQGLGYWLHREGIGRIDIGNAHGGMNGKRVNEKEGAGKEWKNERIILRSVPMAPMTDCRLEQVFARLSFS